MAFSLFGKRDNQPETPEAPTPEPAPNQGDRKPGSFFDRMKQAVTRTRESLSGSIASVVALTREVDEASLDDLEFALLAADIGSLTTNEIIASLRERALRHGISSGAELKSLLKAEILRILNSVNSPVTHAAAPPEVIIMGGDGRNMGTSSALNAGPEVIIMGGDGRNMGTSSALNAGPEVILLVGVNGTGKTTTSGKLAALYRREGRTVILCAADTFRAAAIEQLAVWADRSGVDLIKTRQGGDPSAALFDALTAAKARGTDVLLVDTAGRLHTKSDLMKELDKMVRTSARLIPAEPGRPAAPHQTLLVIDATTGQNGLQQARLFTEAAHVTGIVLTKLDGSAKGGIVVAIARELGLPVRYAGVGEKLEDILPFDPASFVDSLLD